MLRAAQDCGTDPSSGVLNLSFEVFFFVEPSCTLPTERSRRRFPLKGRFPALDDVSFVFWEKGDHAEADRQRQNVRKRAIC